MLPVSIKAEVIVGTSIDNAFLALQKLANTLDCFIESDLNQTMVIIGPGGPESLAFSRTMYERMKKLSTTGDNCPPEAPHEKTS